MEKLVLAQVEFGKPRFGSLQLAQMGVIGLIGFGQDGQQEKGFHSFAVEMESLGLAIYCHFRPRSCRPPISCNVKG